MFFEYLFARLVSLVAGPVQLLGDLQEYAARGGLYEYDYFAGLRFTYIFDSVAPLSNHIIQELILFFCTFLLALLITVFINSGKPYYFKRVLFVFGTSALFLGALGLFSRVFWLIDYHKFEDFYGRVFGPADAIMVGGVKDCIWICVGFLFRSLFSMKGMATVQQQVQDNVVASTIEAPDTPKPVEKRFVCRNCGEKSTGWYQACPHCGAVGKMEKVSTAQAQVSRSIPSEQLPSNATAEEPILFCRECGTRLKPDALFCSMCGTPDPIAKQQSAEQPSHDEQIKQTVLPTPMIQEKTVTIDLHDRKLSPTLRRAFLFAEDGEWDRAEEYLEKVLDEEPENPYAYLGKLMVELKTEKVDILKQKIGEVTKNRNYRRALLYSDKELKSFLDSLCNKDE